MAFLVYAIFYKKSIPTPTTSEYPPHKLSQKFRRKHQKSAKKCRQKLFSFERSGAQNSAAQINEPYLNSRHRSHNKGEYFVGTSGDYLAIRKDDISDIYIIQREIFAQTYEKVKG